MIVRITFDAHVSSNVDMHLQDMNHLVVDELFIQRIEEILQGMHDWRFRFATHQALDEGWLPT